MHEDSMPPLLEKRLSQDDHALAIWEKLPPSHQKEHIKYILEAKKEETQIKRIESTIQRLLQNK